MSRPRWINWALAAGAGALALTLLLPTSNRTVPKPIAMQENPQKEHASKQRLKVQDIKATDLLTRVDAKQHLGIILDKTKTMNEVQLTRYMKNFKIHTGIFDLFK